MSRHSQFRNLPAFEEKPQKRFHHDLLFRDEKRRPEKARLASGHTTCRTASRSSWPLAALFSILRNRPGAHQCQPPTRWIDIWGPGDRGAYSLSPGCLLCLQVRTLLQYYKDESNPLWILRWVSLQVLGIYFIHSVTAHSSVQQMLIEYLVLSSLLRL